MASQMGHHGCHACCLWPAVNKGEEEMNYEGERRMWGGFIKV